MKRKYKRILILIIGFLSISVGIYIVIKNFDKNIVFFYTPSEIPGNSTNKILRIGGIIEKNTILKLSDMFVTFKITDNKNSIKVKYRGFIPSLFREEQGIVAKGIINDDNILIATELLAKHDENYMPKEVYDNLRNNLKAEK